MYNYDSELSVMFVYKYQKYTIVPKVLGHPLLMKGLTTCNDEAVSLDPSAALLCLRTGLTSISQSQASDTT